MQITYLGHSSFRIKTNNVTIVTDPYAKMVGYRFPKSSADIVTISHHHRDHDYTEGIKNASEAFIIDGPGEYEVKEVMVKGIRTYHDNENGAQRGKNTIYIYEMEDIVLAHLGDLGHPLSEKQLKELEDVQVLFIPVGGVYTIDAKLAASLIKQIEPSLVVPMHYKQEGMSETFSQLITAEDFSREIEMEPKRDSKLVVTPASLPEETELVVLERKE